MFSLLPEIFRAFSATDKSTYVGRCRGFQVVTGGNQDDAGDGRHMLARGYMIISRRSFAGVTRTARRHTASFSLAP